MWGEKPRVNQFNEQLISEEKLYKTNIQDLLTPIEQQTQWIEVTTSKITSLAGPPNAGFVGTPEVESEMRTKPPFETPILTKFSEIEPVLKGAGSYEQFKF